MATPGRRAGGNRPRNGPSPSSALWLLIALIAVIFSVVTVGQFTTLIFGTPGTGRVLRCGQGDDSHCVVAWRAGDRGGTERMEIGGAPGETLPVRVLGDNVVDARAGAWIYTAAMMLLFSAAAVVTVVLPAAWLVRRSLSRSLAEQRLRESPDQLLAVADGEIRNRDGTLFAKLHLTHPGPDFPPSSCSIAVVSPAGALNYTVDFGVADPRRRETVVHGPDGRPLAVVRRWLMHQAHADVLAPDEGAPPVATIRPVNRFGTAERAVIGPDGERLGTVLASTGAGAPTTVSVRQGSPGPLRAGVLGFALTLERFYPAPRLERADEAWLKSRDLPGR